DDFASQVQQGTTAVTRVDRCVCLQVIFTVVNSGTTAFRTDDTIGHTHTDSERVTDRQNPVADFHFGTVAQGNRLQVGSINMNYSDVRTGISTNIIGSEFTTIIQSNLYYIGAIHHMRVGHDQTAF